jgi:hypothetical protein
MVAAKAPTMSEIEFERAVVDIAHTFDWMVASFRPAQTSKGWRTPVKYDGKGWPDLVLVHGTGHLVFAELKAPKGILSPEQKRWGELLASVASQQTMALHDKIAGPLVHYCVWKPTDADAVAALLSFGRVKSWTL